MEISKINSTSFGMARLDKNSRDWIFVTKSLHKTDTSELESLLRDNFDDKYVRFIEDSEGITKIKICHAQTPIIGLKDIVVYEAPSGKKLQDIMPIVVENLKKIGGKIK